MSHALRRLLHRAIPAHFQDPFGLAKRLIRSGDPAAHFALQCAALEVAATPLDWAMQWFEHRQYRRSANPELPLLFVCGPPRSGTTVVAQAILSHLPVTYLSNLTAVFPRSPLTATRVLGRFVRQRGFSTHSYYGKSRHLSGPNDALYIWDRWLGADRTRSPQQLGEATAQDMRRFFAAWQARTGKALLNKCNNLNASAHLVGEVLERARFICLTRDPLYLAQSLLQARRDIHGTTHLPYGLTHDGPSPPAGGDDLDDVCEQVRFHKELERQQVDRLGAQRFWVLSYEAFCRDPGALLRRIVREVPGLAGEEPPADFALPALQVSQRIKIDPGEFEQLHGKLIARGIVAA